MIYCLMYGRLGNNLMQIATAAALAKRTGQAYAMCPQASYWCAEPDNCYLPQYIAQFKTNIFRKVPFVESVPEGLVWISGAQYAQMDDIARAHESVVLDGCFFESLYFDQETVQEVFAIDEATEQYIDQHYAFLEQGEWCSVVVRRGDYLDHLDDYSLCSARYYTHAMRAVAQERGQAQQYLILSDDIRWCEEHIGGGNFNLRFVQDEPPIIDLYLASRCRNHIISNSTFAAWGVLIAPQKGVVAMPKPWFNLGNRHHERDLQTAYSPEWMRISNYSWLQMKGCWQYLNKVIHHYYHQIGKHLKP